MLVAIWSWGWWFAACPPPEVQPIRVTVLTILASEQPGMSDPRLEELAVQLRKRQPKFRTLRLVAAESQSIAIGQQGTFALTDKQQLSVRVESTLDEHRRIRLTLSMPGIDRITYSCVCDKYFPVVTPYRNASGDTLIVAVMAKPCTVQAEPTPKK